MRYIVPTLGAIALSVPAYAAEPEVTIGGFVDAISAYTTGPNNPDSSLDTPNDIDFSGDAELQVGVDFGDGVSAQLDIDTGGNSGDFDHIEQANVTWAINDNFSIMMGRAEGVLGWEAWDAPGLYRIGTSPVFGQNGIIIDTAMFSFDSGSGFSGAVYLADDIYGGADANRDSDQLSVGIDLTYANDLLALNLDYFVDQGAVDDGSGLPENFKDITGFNLNGDVNIGESAKVFFDVASRDFDVDDTAILGYMLGGNYAFSDNMSATAMFSMVTEETGPSTENETTEIAFALLTTPTSNPNFAVNYEVSILSFEDGSTVDYDDQTQFAIEFLAIIP